jgi:hypothetical protein
LASNSPENFEVDKLCVLKENAISAEGSCTLIYSTKLLVKRKLAGMEVTIKLEKYRGKSREDMSVPVRTIYKEELSDI